MGFKEALFHGVATLIIERPAKSKSYDQLIAALEQSGTEIEQRAAAAKNVSAAQAVMRHLTGIERWSQNRLRCFLGTAYVRDEYDSYQPGAALDLRGQIAAFHETRQETVALARQLQAANLPDTATVAHNDFGPLTARGWLSYMTSHAARESTKIK
jgi:hypothetical protein